MEQARGEVVSIEIEAVVIRADGSVEDLGTVSAWRKDDDDADGPQGEEE
jgi:hypothetical protein